MEAEVGLAHFENYRIVLIAFGRVIPAKLLKSGLKKPNSGNFEEKELIFKYLAKILAKKLNHKSQQYFLSLKMKSIVLLLTFFTYFSEIDKILAKNSGKCE